MSNEIVVPDLGEGVESATVVRWLKQPGDAVTSEETLAELETDKVTVEVPSPASGRLITIITPEGAQVTTGALLGMLEHADNGVDIPSATSSTNSAIDHPQTAGEPSDERARQPKTEPEPNTFDAIVIGSGPAGYVFAIRAAQLGLKVACVEKRETLGGTCLNIGCIPSKALLQSSENFHSTRESWAEHGIGIDRVTLDLARMQARKADVVVANVRGVEFLFKKNAISWIRGEARLVARGQVAVGDAIYHAEHVVIATGSESMPLPGISVDEQRIVTSTGALELSAVPEHLVVIGGGFVGLELGSVWRRLGATVTVVEFAPNLVPIIDGEIGKAFQRTLEKQGIRFRLSTKVLSAQTVDAGVNVTIGPAGGGETEELRANIVLVSVGRRPLTRGLGLEKLGVALDKRGFVETNAAFETNIPGVYAIGDVTKGPLLAHKAEDEGVALAERLAGRAAHVNYDVIPSVVYTWPEVASIGSTEEQLKQRGLAYQVGKFPFSANGRARALGYTDGFVKILAEEMTGRIFGAHIIGPDAGTLIAEVAPIMERKGTIADIVRTSHAHPSLSEAVREAALAVEGRALHI